MGLEMSNLLRLRQTMVWSWSESLWLRGSGWGAPGQLEWVRRWESSDESMWGRDEEISFGISIFFLCIGIWAQRFMLAMLVLYHLSHSTSLRDLFWTVWLKERGTVNRFCESRWSFLWRKVDNSPQILQCPNEIWGPLGVKVGHISLFSPQY
jgi:hypothetical protein